MAVQVAGGLVGTIMAHAMFALPLLEASLKVRTGGAQWLLKVLPRSAWSQPFSLASARARFGAVAGRPLYHGGVWFTSSTSFANPAVAIARSMTILFPVFVPRTFRGFVAAELCGALAAMVLMNWLLRHRRRPRLPMAKEAHDCEQHEIEQIGRRSILGSASPSSA